MKTATGVARSPAGAVRARGVDVGLVLIASAGHSGSTLLDLLLGNHSAISGAGEMNRLSLYPGDRLCGCGSTVTQCAYWSRIRSNLGATLGHERLRWDQCHTDVPPLEPLLELEDVGDLPLVPDGPIPPRLAAGLAERGIMISAAATLAYGGLRDRKWRLLDPESRATLVLRREEGCLRVYPPLVEWKNPLRKLPSPLELAVALGACRSLWWVARWSQQAAKHLEAARNSWSVAETMAGEDGAKFVVDSSKSAIRLKLLHIMRPERVHVVHLVRDGRAVAASAIRRRGAPPALAARTWKRENLHLTLALRGIPSSRIHRVRYEDLCDDTAGELNRICEWLRIPFEPAMARLGDRPVHNIPGNPMLFDKTRREITRDERWRRELSVADARTIERITGRLNQALGYS